MHANDFLSTYRTQATALPVHLTIRLYDPIHAVVPSGTMYVVRLVLQAIVSVIFRNNFALVAADTIVRRPETKISNM